MLPGSINGDRSSSWKDEYIHEYNTLSGARCLLLVENSSGSR
jgi:hypothetical protein